jgi:hypothetical protein
MEMLSALRENSPSSKHLQIQEPAICGQTHAHDMVEIILCSLIAQHCSVLASFSFTGLFIADAAPRAASESDDTVTM